MRRILLWALGILVLLFALIYAGDYLSLRYRIWKNRQPFEVVKIQPYYAIHEKNGKTEYDFAPPENETCVHSLFPHSGYNPCWYVNRHTERRIEI